GIGRAERRSAAAVRGSRRAETGRADASVLPRRHRSRVRAHRRESGGTDSDVVREKDGAVKEHEGHKGHKGHKGSALVLVVVCLLRCAGRDAAAQTTTRKPASADKAAVADSESARAARERAAEQDVDVEATLDRSAMWVADRVTYTVALTCR